MNVCLINYAKDLFISDYSTQYCILKKTLTKKTQLIKNKSKRSQIK